MTDVLARLQVDAGTLTIGRLVQDREAAITEIGRLREELRLLKASIAKRESPGLASRAVVANARAAVLPQHPKLLLRLSDVCVRVALSRSTVYKRVAEGTFPAPIRVSERSVRWRAEDLDEWQEAIGSSHR